MQIETLDHVALWSEDRETLAAFLTQHAGMHEIERTERFTLVGSDARRGKLTLFAAEGERVPGVLARVGLRVHDLDAAVAALPAGLAVEWSRGRASFTAPEGLRVELVEAEEGVDYDLDHIAFRIPDPEATFAALAELGFDVRDGRLRAGEAEVVLEQGDSGESERPLLNHLGLRVESADEHIQEAEERGLEIADVVDAPNTYAVFLWGPNHIKLEYVEHKPTFSLT
ncbi:MAG TPA: VOC family protein [Gaiellaceae bacterium]|nr:VOC family protein [Gaiellaceae bacterium]